MKVKVEDFVDQINDLPVLPEIGRKIIAIADSPKPNVQEISELIQKDPAITAKILKLINSGYYTLRQQVISIRQAVILLGLQQVRNVVITMLAVNHFIENDNAPIRHLDFWNHSLGVATIAQVLGKKFGFNDTGDLYLAGLLHDIGKLVIETYAPIDMNWIIRTIDRSNVPMYDAELKVLGFTHAEVGGLIVARWMFPDRIADAIRNHHDCQRAKHRLFAAILEMADLFTKARLFAVHGDQFHDFVLQDQTCWQIICEELGDQSDIDLERLFLEMDDEIERARELVKQAREP